MSTKTEDNIILVSAKGINDKAEQAKSIADDTAQYFWFTSEGQDTGAHITEIPQEDFLDDPSNGGANLLARSNGIAVRDGLTELATFGANGATIGETTKTHLDLDYHSIKGIDKGGNTYFHVSDLRDSSGYAVLAESFIGDGSTVRFTCSLSVSSIVSVKVNGTAVSYQTITQGVQLATAPADEDEIEIVYATNDNRAKAYTFGTRVSSSPTAQNIGGYSVAEGENVKASGVHSHAEGYYTVASGGSSHAEGYDSKAGGGNSHAEGAGTEAIGMNSHAEGRYSKAKGSASHAGGQNTIASGVAQTAIGRYNIEDTTSLFIIGNGSASNRSNALKVDQSGNVDIKGEYRVNGSPIGGGGVTGVKGNAEGSYRTGNVNLTPANIGAVPTSRTVNSKALSSDIALDPSDLGEADFVIEQNTANGWLYRKWNSGIAECWCTVTITARTNSSDAGGYVSESAATPQAFPFTFTSVPNVQVTCDSGSITGSVTSTARPSTTSAGSWKLYRHNTNAGTQNKNFMFYVIGSWK